MDAYLRPSVAKRREAGLDGSPSARASRAEGPAAATYDCFGVIVHHGTMNAGHYTTYVKHCGRWYNCDDAWVASVSEEEVQAARAYLLFYMRRGATADALRRTASLMPAAIDDVAL
mmetsp:Transcript_3126/g.10303  ORF Transcript_3126/g.10303 Transcript_3126/m.10303 type:complete len:116 (+) Transcript_3126:1063-1410(+)